ncbi:uncharacterized protein LOC113565394 [Drosophila persimilis]|uniref:uncharacterized protein LOC113565394 n=1 Tax=Drosophila persimilis TaxID=7234 RepID=UPI000F0927B6|nr:uncharacterized protein LOC113565394 [Drosophila persimilis]
MRLCLFYLITFFLFLGVQADKGANKRTGEKGGDKGGEKGGGSGKFSSNLADADSDKMAKERKEGIAKLWKRWHYQMEKHGYTLPFSNVNKDSTAASEAVTTTAPA